MHRIPLNELVPILQLAIGPVILISGIGLLLLTLTNRFGRLLDRARLLSRDRAGSGQDAEGASAQIDILHRRAAILRLSIILGAVAGARSGDKGGSANIGVWVRTDAQWRWLANALTVEALRELLPEATDLSISRHLLPRLRAINFVIEGILGKGVAYQARFDPQAKGLGEWLRSRHVDIPEELVS